MKTMFKWTLIGLTLVNLNHLSQAWAGNGADHGGGGDQATLEGMLPKTVTQRLTYKFVPVNPAAYVEKTQCDLILSCYHSPEQAIVDTQMVLVASPSPHYEISAVRAYYLLNGAWHTLQTQSGPNDRWPQVWTYGDHYKTASHGMWNLTLWAFNAGAQIQVTLDGSDQESLSDRFLRIRNTLFAQADYGSVTEMKSYISEIAQLQSVIHSLQPIWIDLAPVTQFTKLFSSRLEDDSHRLFALGKSAVNPQDGSCDTQKYQRLLAELKAWVAGSPAYFYRLGSDDPFTADQQIGALGVRQALRESLNDEIVPYCEAQVANSQSQVDLILNND